MKYAFLIIALSFCIFTVSFSEENVISKYYPKTDTAGLQPLGIYMHKWCANVFCAGRDNNFNNIFEPDSGDVLPSWWVAGNIEVTLIGGSNSAQEYTGFKKLKDLNFGAVPFPFRPAVKQDSIFLYSDKLIRCFLLREGTLLIDSISSLYPDAMAVSGNILAIAQKTYQGQDTVFLMDFVNKKITDTIITGDNVGMLMFENIPGSANPKLYILNEGNYGLYNSQIHCYDLNTKQSWFLKTGGMANHISLAEISDKHYLIVTMNGSHEIAVIDPLTHLQLSSIKTNTRGYNGPRESYQLGADSPYIATTCYNGKLYASDFLKSKVVDSLDMPGKPEALAVDMHTSIFITCPFITNSYNLTNLLTVLHVLSDAKDETVSPAHAIVFPNPAIENQMVKVKLTDKIISYSVTDLNGQRLITNITNNIGTELLINTDCLNTGVYMLQLETSNAIINKLLTIVK